MSENIKVTTDKNSELYSMLNTLDNKFRNSSHYTTWIRFTCGKNLIVDTKLQSIQTSTHGNYSIRVTYYLHLIIRKTVPDKPTVSHLYSIIHLN